MAAARKKSDGSVFIAITSGSAENAKTGESAVFVRGRTRVRQGHWLLKQVPDAFEAVEEHVHYDVEAATAAPGVKRGSSPAKKPAAAKKAEPKAAAAKGDEGKPEVEQATAAPGEKR